MLNVLWRFLLTILFVVINLLILTLVLKVADPILGFVLSDEMRNLSIVILVILSLITGIWGTWSRAARKDKVVTKTIVKETETPKAPEVTPVK